MTSQVMTTEQIRTSRTAPKSSGNEISLLTQDGFDLAQRVAKMMASSNIVPDTYRIVNEKRNADGSVTKVENPNAVPNCIMALNMAHRMGADPLMIMQNLVPIQGRPSWSSQYIIASINTCGRYTPLRFKVRDLGLKKVKYKEKGSYNKAARRYDMVEKEIEIHDFECIAWAIEKESGETLESSPITIELAVQEGWYTKDGSKWQTMRDQMMRYRSAAFFGRIYAPELLMGIRSTEEEVERIIDVTPREVEPITVEDVAKKATAKKSEKVAETVVDEVKTVEEKAQMIPTASINNVIAEFDAAQTQDDLEALYNTRVMPHYSSIRTEDHDRLNQAHEKNTARLSQQQEPDNHQQPDADDPFGNME